VTRLAALALLLTACGGHIDDVQRLAIAETDAGTPDDAFVRAACRHIGCPGWPTDRATCEASWTMAVAKNGPQDAACLDAATATLERAACGDEANAAADGVVEGKCAR
jgi:hypothetical protein